MPNTGDLPNTWGSAAINPDLQAIDGFLGGVQTISVTNAPIALTSPSGSVTPTGGPTQAQNAVLRFTGSQSADVQVTLPLPGYYIIDNSTIPSGNFVLSFAAPGATQIICVQNGSVTHIYNDGSAVSFVNLPPVGTYLDYATVGVPRWISACTKPPYLNCNGSTFSGATYPALAGVLGGTTLPDFRGVSPAYLNQGTGRITPAGSGLNGDVLFSIGGEQTHTLSGTEMPTHSHTVFIADPGHSHGVSGGTFAGNGALAGVGTGATIAIVGAGAININAAHTGQTIGSNSPNFDNNTTTNNGGNGPHNNVQPTTIAGIRLIRAA